MIDKSLITFDACSQTGGCENVRFLCEELLAEPGPLQVVYSVFCRLPFRLRVGSRALFDVRGVIPGRIAVFNSVDVPSPHVGSELLCGRLLATPGLASDVLITLTPLNVEDTEKESIAAALKEPEYGKAASGLQPLNVHPEDPLNPLNSLIVSYRVLCGEEVQWNRVRRVLRKDLCGGTRYTIHMFKRRHDTVDFSQIEAAIAGVAPASPIPFALGGVMHDISAETIIKLQKRVGHATQYVFYSLAIQAQDYIQQTDFLNALLYSVIAFENAHAELVEHVAETKAGCPAARTWAQELLREAGISAVIRLTPSLFMDAENRPSETTVKDVIRAIRIRNELAHAKRDRQGNLKVDSHRSSDLLPLIEAVFSYLNAIVRQLPD